MKETKKLTRSLNIKVAIVTLLLVGITTVFSYFLFLRFFQDVAEMLGG